MIDKREAIKLIDEVSLAITEGGDVPVVKLTKIFDYVLEDDKVLLTTKQVCNKYGVANTLVYEWFKRGLKKTSCGGTKIRITDLEEFIQSGKA